MESSHPSWSDADPHGSRQPADPHTSSAARCGRSGSRATAKRSPATRSGIPNGCFWEGAAELLVGTRPPALADRLTYDSEAGAFLALGAAALIERIVARLGLPLVVKPRAGGSSFGVSRVEGAGEVAEALMACFGYHDCALVEQAVAGMEIAVGVVDTGDGPVALPAVEIEPAAGRAYDYAARYTAGATNFYTPARLAPAVLDAAARAALLAHQALGLRDLSRTDMIVDAAGTPQFLEVNVAPGMTETSTWPLALAAAGLDLAVVCRDLAARAHSRPTTVNGVASA
ncbi:D-alanine--D-alanine ligase family protein [Candidatus Frankia nodulisporulans]|uniref:D-alanine--D-alanine ligase family protein n=1 Tax=Candidatus Frankia nodulisporulans TaxID=2060052 RepID=UPI001CDC3025|nr:hypothetical protein [Candidatus Frankia nodulisporulans]